MLFLLRRLLTPSSQGPSLLIPNVASSKRPLGLLVKWRFPHRRITLYLIHGMAHLLSVSTTNLQTPRRQGQHEKKTKSCLSCSPGSPQRQREPKLKEERRWGRGARGRGGLRSTTQPQATEVRQEGQAPWDIVLRAPPCTDSLQMWEAQDGVDHSFTSQTATPLQG